MPPSKLEEDLLPELEVDLRPELEEKTEYLLPLSLPLSTLWRKLKP